MTDLPALRDWLDRYERAWRSNASPDVADLFTEGAVYRWRPWDTADQGGASGRQAIVDAWLGEPDDPSAWTLECEPLAVNGTLGIARCVTRYARTDQRPSAPVYDNIWLVELDADGRCSDFTEFYMERRPASTDG